MKYQKLLAATGTDAIMPVINGLAVEADGIMLTHAQADAVEASLAQQEALATQLQQLNEQLATQATALQAAQDSLATVQQELATTQQDLATAQQDAQQARTELAAIQGQTNPPGNTDRPDDPKPVRKPVKMNSMMAYAAKHGIPVNL